MFLNQFSLSLTLLVVGPASIVFYFILTKAFIYYARSSLAKSHLCKPVQSTSSLPGPVYWLLQIRSTLSMLADGSFFEWGRTRHQQYGTTFSSPGLLGTEFETSNPDVIKAMLATNFKDFDIGARKDATGFLLGNSIVNTDGAEWHRARGLLRPAFNRNDIGNFDGLEHHVSHLIDILPHDGSTVDLQDHFFRLTGDAAIEYLLGKRIHSAGPSDDDVAARHFFDAYNDMLALLVNPFRDGVLNYFFPSRQFKANKAAVFAYVDQHVQSALAQTPTTDKQDTAESHVLVHSLASQIPAEPIKIRSEMLAVLNAGTDTTGALLTNLWQVLPQHPRVMSRLRADIAFLAGAPPTYAQLKELKFLQWTLTESLRLHPVIPLNARFASHDVILPSGGGVEGIDPLLVPKGSSILYDTYTLHRRADIYGADVLEFRPERWEALRPGWAFVPFHGGPRTCIGQQLALTEVGYTTVRLLQAFGTIESRDDEGWTPGFVRTLLSANGAKVSLRP